MCGIDDPATAAAVRAYVKLLRARGSVVARVERSLGRHRLTLLQLGVLEAILHRGPMTHRQLCRTVLTSAGNLTDLIDKLAGRGLVCRVRDQGDRRLVRAELTAAGRALIEAVFPAHAADIAAAMAGLTPPELLQLEALLRKLGLAARGSSEQDGATAGEAGTSDAPAPARLAPQAPAPHLARNSFDTERLGGQESDG